MIGAVGGAIYVELGLSDFEPGLCHRDSDIENSRPEIRPQNSRSRAAFMKFSDAETSGSRANPRKSRPFCYDLEMTQRDDSGWLGRQDSNLGMAESKSAALPLGYAPTAAQTSPHGARTITARSGAINDFRYVCGVGVPVDRKSVSPEA